MLLLKLLHSSKLRLRLFYLRKELSKLKGIRHAIFSYIIHFLKSDFRPQFFQFSSVAQSCLTLCNPMNSSTSGLPVHRQFLSPPKPMSIESMMPSSHLILCRPLLLLPSIPPSIRVFSNESTLRMRWPKYWSFSLSISPSNEYPGLISFRMD